MEVRGKPRMVMRMMVWLNLMTFLQMWFLCSANYFDNNNNNNMVFQVKHKFGGRGGKSLAELKAHDAARHARYLTSVDLEIGGSGYPTEAGLYYAKISIGNPLKDYYVQVDSGSDLLWLNCQGCDNCPTKSDTGISLTPYDYKSSSSASLVTCGQDSCKYMLDGQASTCKSGERCQFSVSYGDGSSTAGYFVKDTMQLSKVSSNSSQSATTNGSVIFGCGDRQSGGSDKSTKVDGIIGFGQSQVSMISQLAADGKVKRIFSHCLDSVHGGGIFSIGEVVEPKVKTVPMVPNQPHYNVLLKSIEVGGDVLQFSGGFFSSNERGVVIDSGTTLAYLPPDIYEQLMSKITSKQSGIKLENYDGYTCFSFSGNVDDDFPVVQLRFEDSVTLAVYPHDYLFQRRSDSWCVGWQSSGMKYTDGKQMTLLGDLVLSNRLFVYDIENQVIGWTEYNCSSTIKVKDDNGAPSSLSYHRVSSASSHFAGSILIMLAIISLLNSLSY